jgi:DNA-binding GntR family transcriptional regulator
MAPERRGGDNGYFGGVVIDPAAAESEQPRPVVVADGSERVSAVDWVGRLLRKSIVRGDLPGGSLLVQTEIAAQLQVSTTPVREAMRNLAAEGLISMDNHKVGIVRKLDWDEMAEIVEIRRSLEPLAARLAVPRISADLLDRARALADDLLTELDVGEWVEKNNEFHNLFRDATGTKRLALMMRALGEATGVFVAQSQRLDPEIRGRAVGEHYQLIEAYSARDVDKVIRIQHDHVALSLAHLQDSTAPLPAGVGGAD